MGKRGAREGKAALGAQTRTGIRQRGRRGFIREEGRPTALVFGGEVFLLGPERGCRAEIRAQFPCTKQKDFYVCRAHCQCTDRPSGPRSVNATVLVQTASCLLNCNVYLSICNLWTAYFQGTCLTTRNCLRWQLRHLFILFYPLLLPFSSQCSLSGKGDVKKQRPNSQAP